MSDGTFPRPFGRYELLGPLGRGGMGQTWKARALGPDDTGQLVVIKTIHPELAKDAKLSRMFIEEAHLVARLLHPNIVKVFDLAEGPDGELFMALEYVDGVDLRKILEHASARRLKAPVWFHLHIACEVLRGLEHAHTRVDSEGQPAPVIHRDVTPSNILLSVAGEVKLSDFGIAIRGERAAAPSASLAGKAAYMAPELLEGLALDARADVFSLGVVLWECLALRPLFAAAADFDSMLAITQGTRVPPSELNPEVSPELDRIVLTALEPDPDRRFPSAHALLERLSALLQLERPRLDPEEVRHVTNVLMGLEHPSERFGAPETVGASPSSPGPKAAARRLEIPAASTTRMAPAVLSELVLHSVRATMPPTPVRPSRGPQLTLRQTDGRTISPLAPLDALTYLGSRDIVALSVDGERWIERERAALLVGASDLLDPSLPLAPQAAGTLGGTSPLAVLASIALQALNGRLYIDGPENLRAEVDVRAGRPSFVRFNDPNLRTHLLLSRSGLLPASEVESVMEASFRAEERLETLVALARGVEPAKLRSLVLEQELAVVLALETGQYAFDPQSTPRLSETGQYELAPLFLAAVELGLTVEDLERRLLQQLSSRFEPAEGLGTVLAQLPLADACAQAMDRICQGAPPRMAVGEVPGREKHRLLATLYLLREIGLLQPTAA